ncbi:hypothetical protein U14_02622 [Candidatus Moduliflexus flocculans]|uniref:CRISPR type III-associated protein domain-containing protein n=1 Tax=Candidatus Moduliflexus flocculans TaxID=1499966 RepID=A0A081BLW2_9BACT|nr:hypothetical protein U14_02622 [Candidatus Moduliflexus flocculans]
MEHPYYPNPFDFVPFPQESPDVKTPQEWTQQGVCCTGYFDVRIKALTPVHIVGDQKVEEHAVTDERKNYRILHSDFYRRYNIPIIPASTIRGCLRVFLEAACNCWASQLTPYYEKEYGGQFPHKNPQGRHIGFRVLDRMLPEAQKANSDKIDETRKTAVPTKFYPTFDHSDGIDLTSYLFGCVLPKDEHDESGPAWKGRIIIEDARISEHSLADRDQYDTYTLPDIDGTAFMGGAKPSASNWWYMRPAGIQRRGNICEFIGDHFRGRKFYYHQNPQRCVREYVSNSRNWSRKFHPLYSIPLECLRTNETTEPFRVYFENLPERYLNLLLFALFPGTRIRHKLGYGKSYGYGSVAFEYIQGSGRFRENRREKSEVESIGRRYAQLDQAFSSPETLFQTFLSGLAHRESLEHLNRILWYQNDLSQVFMYPPFQKGGFQFSAKPREVEQLLETFLGSRRYQDYRQNQFISLPPAEAQKLAETLWRKDYKAAVDFEVYQQHASGFQNIASRRTF